MLELSGKVDLLLGSAVPLNAAQRLGDVVTVAFLFFFFLFFFVGVLVEVLVLALVLVLDVQIRLPLAQHVFPHDRVVRLLELDARRCLWFLLGHSPAGFVRRSAPLPGSMLNLRAWRWRWARSR